MHLLVLSAFRPEEAKLIKRVERVSQCTFWCSVLSDQEGKLNDLLQKMVSMHLLVLSAFRPGLVDQRSLPFTRLNAPFGAQCFPTCFDAYPDSSTSVSMHLLVLSAFRRKYMSASSGRIRSQCTFWCSVLSDHHACRLEASARGSQCTFWCSVLSDKYNGVVPASSGRVSMHLLVLSAFRQRKDHGNGSPQIPSQCTFWCSVLSDHHACRLEASARGSQCTFWCSVLSDKYNGVVPASSGRVSMHLLVLSAFRQRKDHGNGSPQIPSQCTFWCSVLSDMIGTIGGIAGSTVSMHLLVLSAFRQVCPLTAQRSLSGSQCTFWCSVLSDA